MLTTDQARDACAALVAAATQAGADAADAVLLASSSHSVGVRLGALEDVDRSEGADIALRVFAGRRSASVGATDLAEAGFAALAERALAMARAAPEDPYAGLAPADLLLAGPPPMLDLLDPTQPRPETLRDRALAAEDAARVVPGVTNSEGASAGHSRGIAALATSTGFAGAYAISGHSCSAGVVAQGADGRQRDSAGRSARHMADLPDPAIIGAEAGMRAVARRDPGTLPSGAMPVVFDPRVSGSLVGHLLGAMNGAAIARRASFLLGHEGEALFDPAIRILERPHRLRGLRSRPFDGEGLPTAPRSLVEGGRITGWLANASSARQLGIALTGHASRGGGGAPGVSASNVELAAGTVSRAALIADIADGVLVTELVGQGVNPVTGDYSRGAAGFRIVNGAVAGPVAGFTIAGNLRAMFAAMVAADDLEHWRGINVPSLRVDTLMVAGD